MIYNKIERIRNLRLLWLMYVYKVLPPYLHLDKEALDVVDEFGLKLR